MCTWRDRRSRCCSCPFRRNSLCRSFEGTWFWCLADLYAPYCGLNLRPVLVRQGAEAMMTVAFLEVALSYLAVVEDQSSFTHSDNLRSWADLKEGYLWLALGLDSGHVLFCGFGTSRSCCSNGYTALTKAAEGTMSQLMNSETCGLPLINEILSKA